MGQIRRNKIIYGGGDALIQPVIYSTEERCIGVWADGKPLYERTYIGGTIPASSNLDIPIDTTNVDEIFISKAVTYSSTQGYSLILNDVIPTYAAHSKRIYISKSASKIVIDNGDTDNFYDRTYVTIIYTKTTDTAGDGDWSPLGIPAVHYSYNEQVVGTWVDGSTIYQKSFYMATGSISSSSHELSIPNDLSGIDRIIGCECTFHEDNDDRDYCTPYFRVLYSESVFPMCLVLADNTVATRLISDDSSYQHLSNIVYTVRYTKLPS